ncbi:MAG: ATP-binding protein, partial [Thermoleophilia bacterium]|nr:ATP-binding protein [Thermoleophilia bacterium]
SRATGGAGIGLAIVHELVRAHDGRIDVESRPGTGSTFRVSLPALDARAS